MRTITRRNFLYLTGLAVTGVVATACGGDDKLPGQTPTNPTPAAPQPATGQQTPAAAPAAYREAPQLAQMVKDGKLPPVVERLPKNPVALTPVERVGKYGGTWRTALQGGADNPWLGRTVGYDYLVSWDPEFTKVIPNVAESFEGNADATLFTFKLREGHKWSDGAPFTADDITFYYEDVYRNKELTPNPGRNPFTVEKVDQYTVRVKFDKSNGLFLRQLATGNGSAWTNHPRHYLQQFHPKYNKDNLDQLIRENNAENWVKLFQLKGGSVPGTPYDARWQNTELPTLYGWRLTTPYSGGPRVALERNPYYFKVDTAGNQLPYLDRVTYDVAQDNEVLVLKAINGEIDMMDRHIATPQNKAVLADNQQKGQYHFFETIPTDAATMVIALNLTHKDPVKRQIFQSKDFRIGLSHAINRQEIIDVVYIGQGEPWQAAPRPGSPFFNERLAKQYTEYDLKKANAHLDKVLPNKDGEGFRLGPDGRRLSFVVESTTAYGLSWTDVLQLVQKRWRQVGVDMQYKNEDRSLLYTRKNANEHDAVVWDGVASRVDIFLDPRWFFPFSNESNFAEAWATWFYNPSGAGARTAPEEPPASTKQQMELYNQLQNTGDDAKQVELLKQIVEIAADQFYVMNISLRPTGYGIVKDNFKNVPEQMPNAWLYPNPAPTNPQQYFIE